ncbi:MAG: MgtC/SapB family protein [Candidatus Thorarchaeota archaeon]
MQELLMSPDLVVRLLLGFAVGALIGVERQKRPMEERTAGVRSFGLHSLLGTLAAYASAVTANEWIFLYALFISAILVAMQIGYKMFRTMKKGTTTSIVFALSFVLGALVGFDTVPAGELIGSLEVLAMTVAFLVFLVLGFKEDIKAAVDIFTRTEMLSAVELGVIILFLWPLLYPYQVIDLGIIEFPLFNTYVMVVILLSISFANYILVKRFKNRGVYFFGFFGGFANSEATVSSLTDFHVKTERANPGRISVSTIFANIAMVLRNGVIVLLLDPSFQIITFYLIPIAVFVVGGVIRLLYERTKNRVESVDEIEVKLDSPFDIGAALRFAIVFGVISFISLVLQASFSEIGMVVAAIFGGFASAGAVVFIACTAFVTGGIALSTAVFAVIIATTMSVLNKMIYVYASDREMTLFKMVAKDSFVMACGVVIYLLLLGTGFVLIG